MTFWIITGAIALISAALLALAALRPRPDAEPAAAYDLRVYRDQLKEVDRDLARGVIGAEDAERVRAEVSRRILAADAEIRASEAGEHEPRAFMGAMAMLIGVAIVAGAFGLYTLLGAPGYGDLALEDRKAAAQEARLNRPAQAVAEASLPPRPEQGNIAPEYKELVEKLRITVADRPDDLQGQALLAQNEARLGNFQAAYAAQAEVLRLKGEEATARDFADYADMLILAAGGYVSPEAEGALDETLKRDPRNPIARYYTGLMMIQTGRPDIAFRMWDQLLRESRPEAPWVPIIRNEIEGLAFRAGVDYELPPLPGDDGTGLLTGPTAEDMDAAQEMTADERQEMIRGMVSRLSERLATEGGSPAEWSRLIGAYGVLGETERAAAIWAEAQQVFGDSPEALAIVREGAARAGVAQ